jgi:hypothetical protein
MNDIKPTAVKSDLETLKEQWYYVIRTDDWDRYLREVYANNELVDITNSSEKAYLELWQLAEKNLSD